MRKPQGYAIWTDPGAPTIEADTFTCIHCNSIVFVDAKTDPSNLGGFCLKCMKHICAACADKGACAPWEKQLEEMEKTITNKILRNRAIEKMIKR